MKSGPSMHPVVVALAAVIVVLVAAVGRSDGARLSMNIHDQQSSSHNHPESSPHEPHLTSRVLGTGLGNGGSPNAAAFQATALDRYVYTPDPSYGWYELEDLRFEAPTWTMYVLNMTSQTWLSEAVTDRSVWWHHVAIVVPTARTLLFRDTAFLLVTGRNNELPFEGVNGTNIEEIVAVAERTGTVAAAVFQVPNSPMHFPSDPTHARRTEDGILSFLWAHYIADNSDPAWIPRLPMTKAAVRAMDTVTAFVAALPGSPAQLSKFVISGESKRGWTTWTTGAVDSRVIAIVPVVLDILNVVVNLHHSFRCLGAWTFAMDDYAQQNVTVHLDTPNFAEMMSIEDPYFYFNRYIAAQLPIFVVTAAGDEFFFPDDSYYYLHDLQCGPQSPPNTCGNGDNHVFLRKIDNTGHLLDDRRPTLYDSVSAFYWSILNDEAQLDTMPHLVWNITHIDQVSDDRSMADRNTDVSSGSSVSSSSGVSDRENTVPSAGLAYCEIVAVVDRLPESVIVWTADSVASTGRRDFRINELGPDGSEVPTNVTWAAANITVEFVAVGAGHYAYVARRYAPQSACAALGRSGGDSEGGSCSWRAFFVEFDFPVPKRPDLGHKFTTQSCIVPNDFPFPSCLGETCGRSEV